MITAAGVDPASPDPANPDRATALSAAQITAVIEQARAITAASGGLTDPFRLRQIQNWWCPAELTEWAEAVLGRPVPGLQYLSWFDLVDREAMRQHLAEVLNSCSTASWRTHPGAPVNPRNRTRKATST
jgi:hypothetical protein